jgi:hypothetical protein
MATTGNETDRPAAVVPTAPSERYRLLDEIARSGMGVIYRATDTALAREVVVKVLQDKYAPESATARRFADEARIAAQLQHPAIPPVHDLGTLPDGRPFLAMKLIKGQTLDELLCARPDLSSERSRFVAVFEQVCQAVAYAHDRLPGLGRDELSGWTCRTGGRSRAVAPWVISSWPPPDAPDRRRRPSLARPWR